MGHSLSLNETHCRLAGGMMSTMALVELTGSVPLVTEPPLRRVVMQ